MRIIEMLYEKINEEQRDACMYAKLALEHKDTDRSLADTFYSLSQDEMRHAMMIHNEVVRIIENYRAANGEPPAPMMAVYDYLHKQAINKAEEVKRYQSMYKD